MTDETKGMLLGQFGGVSFGLTLPVTRFVIPYFDPVFIGPECTVRIRDLRLFTSAYYGIRILLR
jgi:hypothetical protein